MKKIIFTFIIIYCTSVINAQTVGFYRTPEFEISLEYEVIKDTELVSLDKSTGEYKTLDEVIKTGSIILPQQYGKTNGFNCLRIIQGKNIDTSKIKILNQDQFPNEAIYSVIDRNNNNRWVPIWYFDALEKQDRDLILKGESKRASWDGDFIPNEWYKDIPQLTTFVITNTAMVFFTPLYDKIPFLFQSVKQITDTKYEVVAYPDIDATDNDITWDIYKKNFPHIKNGKPVKFIIEINGKTMKVYNGKTKKICFDLIQVSADWVKLYETFIKYNQIPHGLDLPEEYLMRSNLKSNKQKNN